MSGRRTDSCCCCSLRDRCLIFATLTSGLFALVGVWVIATIFIVTSPDFQELSYKYQDVEPRLLRFSIGAFIICTFFVIVAVGLIVGIVKKRSWLLLVFLVVFGIYVALQILVTLIVVISLLTTGVPMFVVYVVYMSFTNVAYTAFNIWGWWSVLLLFKRMTRGPTGQREMKMSLIPSPKPFTDEVDDVEMGNETP